MPCGWPLSCCPVCSCLQVVFSVSALVSVCVTSVYTPAACSFPGENARSWDALGEARPGQSSLSAGALRYRAWAQSWIPSSMHESESEVAQSCLTLCDPMDCSLPGSSVHRKTTWFPPLGKMRPLPATASQGKSPVPP